MKHLEIFHAVWDNLNIMIDCRKKLQNRNL